MPTLGRPLWDDPNFVLGTILPKSPGTFDLGSPELPFRTIYLSEGSIVGDLTVGDDLIFSAATASVIPGATSLLFRNNADTQTNLSITDAGRVTIREDLVFSLAASNIVPGATSFSIRNNADGADNLLITDAGVVTARAAIRGTALQLANSETVAGAGTNQGTAAALVATATVHRITGANGTVGWILPATTVVGTIHILLNTTAGVALVYPATGGTINGAAANAVFTALTGIKPIILYATAADTWIAA